MATYIALLRGVNIGGNTLKMERLRALCGDLGFQNIRTYVQSGNVLFESAEPATACVRLLEEALVGQTRLPVTVIVRKPADFAKVLRSNPYPDAVGNRDESTTKKAGTLARLYVAFLAAKPSADGLRKLSPLCFGDDQFHIAGKEIYLRYGAGYGNSKMTNNLFEKLLGVRATTRNWNSVNKLWEMSGS